MMIQPGRSATFDDSSDARFAELFVLLSPHLTERQRRLLLGAGARALGPGGGARMARISGMSRPTVYKGLHELDEPPRPWGRVRRPGGGAKRLADTCSGLVKALEELVNPDTRTDPESPLRWTCKSTRELADLLTAKGHAISDDTVRRLLHEQGYRLRRRAGTTGGAQHDVRDAQFRQVNAQVYEHLAGGQPVMSVSTRKKELVGSFAGGAPEWRYSEHPEQANAHDFPNLAVGKVIPYEPYGHRSNIRWRSVGCDHDTVAFAVTTLQHWWGQSGRRIYPEATQLLIVEDTGGSGYWIREWKKQLARFAAQSDLDIEVCPFPPGTTKWNNVEHRLSSVISMNWRRRPLTRHEVLVELIGAKQVQANSPKPVGDS
jgi:hypothetical protein